MQTSLSDFNAELRESLVALLWRQWASLGVSSHASSGSPRMVDPEALLLFSTVVARHDARLFDEIIDWLRANGDWINLMRLARLQKESDIGDPRVLGAIASHLAKDSAHLKWKVLAKQNQAGPAKMEPRPLFPHLPMFDRTDQDFRAWGWLRPPLETRGLSRPPRPDQPATFLLKLRALFGRQSRAEVLAWLLTHDSGHPAEIARETGYFRGSLQTVLNELETSGHVFSTRKGREKNFAIRPQEWRFLLTWSDGSSEGFPRWIPWAALFSLFRQVHDLIGRADFPQWSADLQVIELNRVVAPAVAGLMRDGFWPDLMNGSTQKDSLERIVKDLQRLLKKIS